MLGTASSTNCACLLQTSDIFTCLKSAFVLRVKSVLLLPLFWLLYNFLTTAVYVPIKASVSIIFQSHDNDQQQYERISTAIVPITNSNAFSPSFSPLSLAAVTQEEEGGGNYNNWKLSTSGISLALNVPILPGYMRAKSQRLSAKTASCSPLI